MARGDGETVGITDMYYYLSDIASKIIPAKKYFMEDLIPGGASARFPRIVEGRVPGFGGAKISYFSELG